MKIALGVTGGIAAYKAAEIARRLQERDVKVQVVMTEAAQEFVRPLTFAALTGEKVITEMFSQRDSNSTLDSSVEHIAVAQSIDALLVAPATAATLARFAQGLSEDFLSTLYLATTAPVVVAPAMNVNMWRHAATQANLATLRARGVTIVEPGEGYLACGSIGEGRLADTDVIVEAVLARLHQRGGRREELKGEQVLISAGPTYEAIDPVRFIGNRSSGKMGYALAEAAVRRGARVTLVSGPTALTAPAVDEFVAVESCGQMREALLARFGAASITIMTAAVSDFAPAQVAGEKLKREGGLKIEFKPTADILAEMGGKRGPGQLLIGFAAETQNAVANARGKLARKHLDAIVLNDVSLPGLGFGSERNAGEIITADDSVTIAEMSKQEMAERILDVVVKLRAGQGTPKVTA
jgi:phosphopantothenoylcysteine decarboxylase/phosphopantothenate--cysteine ligase